MVAFFPCVSRKCPTKGSTQKVEQILLFTETATYSSIAKKTEAEPCQEVS